jgi:single-stranded-DNA-specific exonuclease
MIQSRYRWQFPGVVEVDGACRELARVRGVSDRLLSILAGRGVADAAALAAFLAPTDESLHDPALLPDAEPALARVAIAIASKERVLVYGDFDADGLTGLSILVLALRRLGLDAAPYVPERLGDGHGLSMRAVERAATEGRTLIVTADCGTSSGAEIEAAAERGIDVVVTDHHHAASWPAAAVAVVNPQRSDSAYPDHDLTGAGVAWKFATLLFRELIGGGSGDGLSWTNAAADLADLAVIGTVADVAPVLGENRAIARMGLARIRSATRPGIGALLERAGLAPDRVDLEDIGFVIAPRLNAAGRVGEAARAARLLLAEGPAEASELAAEIEQANLDRREMTKAALAEARRALGLGPEDGPGSAAPAALALPPIATPPLAGDSVETAPPLAVPGSVAAALPPAAARPTPAAALVVGEWPVGIVGLIAGRLAEELDRPAVVATMADPDGRILRASCRSPRGFNLAEALIACEDILVRHGGHRAAAGFDIEEHRWPEFAARFEVLAGGRVAADGPSPLAVDLLMPAEQLDFALVREVALLEPCGAANPPANIALTGLRVVRVRAASGGHTQLVLRRRLDVLDAIAFRRPDLAATLREGDRIDVVARVESRSFGGFESMQLQILDVAAEGAQRPA